MQLYIVFYSNLLLEGYLLSRVGTRLVLFILLAHPLCISSPDSRRNLSDNLNSYHRSYWVEPSLKICWSVYEWASFGSVPTTLHLESGHPYTPFFTAVSQELL